MSDLDGHVNVTAYKALQLPPAPLLAGAIGSPPRLALIRLREVFSKTSVTFEIAMMAGLGTGSLFDGEPMEGVDVIRFSNQIRPLNTHNEIEASRRGTSHNLVVVRSPAERFNQCLKQGIRCEVHSRAKNTTGTSPYLSSSVQLDLGKAVMFTIPVAAISDDPILADPETILEVAMMIDCVAGGVKVTVLDSTSRETWSLELLELKGPPLILRQISELLSQVMDAFKEPTLKRSMLPISEAALETFTQMIAKVTPEKYSLQWYEDLGNGVGSKISLSKYSRGKMLGFQLSLRPPDAVESELRQYIFHVNFRNDASQTACYEAIVRHHQFIHYNRESLDVFIQIGEEKRKISAGSDFFGYGTIRAGVEYEFGIYFSRVERDKLKKSGGDVAAFEARSRFFGSALDEVKQRVICSDQQRECIASLVDIIGSGSELTVVQPYKNTLTSMKKHSIQLPRPNGTFRIKGNETLYSFGYTGAISLGTIIDSEAPEVIKNGDRYELRKCRLRIEIGDPNEVWINLIVRNKSTGELEEKDEVLLLSKVIKPTHFAALRAFAVGLGRE